MCIVILHHIIKLWTFSKGLRSFDSPQTTFITKLLHKVTHNHRLKSSKVLISFRKDNEDFVAPMTFPKTLEGLHYFKSLFIL